MIHATPLLTVLAARASFVFANLFSSCAVHPGPHARRRGAGGAPLGAGAGATLGAIMGDARGRANSAYSPRPRPYCT